MTLSKCTQTFIYSFFIYTKISACCRLHVLNKISYLCIISKNRLMLLTHYHLVKDTVGSESDEWRNVGQKSSQCHWENIRNTALNAETSVD